MSAGDRQSGQLQRVRRQDVARAAGVSVTTVTHALNPRPGIRVSAATRKRVCGIAQELGYRPNFVGRALVNGRTYTVGLLQPAISSLAYSFYQWITMGLSEAMDSDDYHPLILFRSAACRYLRVIEQGRVDGMMILQSDRDTAVIAEIAARGIPTVAVNVAYDSAAGDGAVCIHSDHGAMMREVIAEFMGCGCRSLLSVHDYRVHDANARLHDVFVEETARLADKGVVGSSLIPAGARFGQQCQSLFASGRYGDAIFVDGAGVADRLVAAGLAEGVQAGRDYQLIVAETEPGRTTESQCERALYSHQPRRIGQRAWGLLKGLIDGSRMPFETLVPYRRVGLADENRTDGTEDQQVRNDEADHH